MVMETVSQAGPPTDDPDDRAVKVDGVWMSAGQAYAGGWCGCIEDDCVACGCDCECHADPTGELGDSER